MMFGYATDETEELMPMPILLAHRICAELAAKRKSESEAEANSPLALQAHAQGEQVAAQGQQLQANARLQRLLQLGQQKGCGKK
jgi:S-adenosylmethionine synthetase